MRGTSTSRICRLPGVEDLADDVPLVLAERLGAGHQVTQFLLGDGLAAEPGITAEQGDDQVGALDQQPDHRPGQHGDPVQQRRGQQRQRGRALQRDPLGRELAQDQAEERDADGHHDERDRARPGRRQVILPGQPGLEEAGQGLGPVRAGDQGGQGHADLHGGEEPVRVLGQPGGPLAPPAALGQRPDLAFAQRDQGHFRACEEPPDEDDDEDDDDVQDDLAHFPCRSPPGRCPWLARSARCVWPV